MKIIGKMLIETLAIRSEKVRKNEKLSSFSFVTFWPPSPISLEPKKTFKESLKKIFVFTWFNCINTYWNSSMCPILCKMLRELVRQNFCLQGAHSLIGEIDVYTKAAEVQEWKPGQAGVSRKRRDLEELGRSIHADLEMGIREHQQIYQRGS